MPSSLIIVGLVAAWLVVLVPMIARKRQEIARTNEATLSSRVVRSGNTRNAGREEFAMSGTSDVDDRDFDRDLDDRPGGEFDADYEAGERDSAERGYGDGSYHERAYHDRRYHGDGDYDEDETYPDEEYDEYSTAVAEQRHVPDDELDGPTEGGARYVAAHYEARHAPEFTADLGERYTHPDDPDYVDDAGLSGRTDYPDHADNSEYADYSDYAEYSDYPEYADDAGDAGYDDPEYGAYPSHGDEYRRFAEQPRAGRADESEQRTEPRRYRPGRGGFDPEAAAMAARAKYAHRQRVVLAMLISAIVTAVLAAVTISELWWAHGVIDVVLVGYLVYLRKQVRLEEEIRQRRTARMERMQRAAGHRADGAGPWDESYGDREPGAQWADERSHPSRSHPGEYADDHTGEEQSAGQRRPSPRPSAPRAPEPAPGTVVVDVDDDDPAFDELDEPGPYPYRRAVGE